MLSGAPCWHARQATSKALHCALRPLTAACAVRVGDLADAAGGAGTAHVGGACVRRGVALGALGGRAGGGSIVAGLAQAVARGVGRGRAEVQARAERVGRGADGGGRRDVEFGHGQAVCQRRAIGEATVVAVGALCSGARSGRGGGHVSMQICKTGRTHHHLRRLWGGPLNTHIHNCLRKEAHHSGSWRR